MDSLKGIADIQLVPAFDYREVVSNLQVALGASKKLRAAVAYWCLGINEFGSSIADRLSGDGFLCVDIHLPTDIDRLCEMKMAGANIYLYLLNPNPQPGELRLKVPPHLLHTKLLLFDDVSGSSELWVGSHNWTARALTGVNIEASLRVRMDVGCGMHKDATDFLQQIRSRCVPFDVNAVRYYKWLQQLDQEEGIWVLELRGSRSIIDFEQKLTVFGESEEDYRNLRNVDKNIVISFLDEDSGKEILYEAAIRDTGRRPSRGGVTFDARVFASHDGSQRPKIEGPKIPGPSVVSRASSWATVDIVEELFGDIFEIPPVKRWVNADDRSADLRIPPELRRWFPNPQRPLVQRAVSRGSFEKGEPESQTGELALRDAGPKLLRKKLVRAKRKDGQLFGFKKRPEDEDEKRRP